MEYFGPWLARELERSEKLQRDVEWLLAEDRRDRLAMPRFETFETIEAMQAHIERERCRSREDRTFKWSEDRVYRSSTDPAPADQCAALDRFQHRLQTRAYYYTGASSAANEFLAAIRRGQMPQIPGGVASQLALSPTVGSTVSAHLSGDVEWKTARARSKAWRGAVENAELDDTFYVRPGPIDGS